MRSGNPASLFLRDYNELCLSRYHAASLDRLLRNTSTLSMAAHTSWTPQFALGHRLAGSTHTKKALTPDTEKQWSEVAKRYIERHVIEIWRGVDIT
jgi:hypothetical protein